MLRGTEPPKAQSQGALGKLRIPAEGAKDIRRLGGCGIARGPGGDRQLPQSGDEALTLDALEGQVENSRHTGDSLSVQVHAAQRGEPLPQPLPQAGQPLLLRGQATSGPLASHAEADDLVRGQRSGAKSPLLAAPESDRLHVRSDITAHVERTDALRAVELVRRDRHEID